MIHHLMIPNIKSSFKQTIALAFMPMSEVNDLWYGIMDKLDHIPHLSACS